MQYRDKTASARELLGTSQGLASLLAPHGVTFIVNDRPDVAAIAGADGVHVGQEDLAPGDARGVVGKQKLVGVSTHSLAQFQKATATSADYIAVGPIFATTSKSNPDPVVGTDLIRQVRGLTEKPIVAIGGITLKTAASVIEAGAEYVCVISDILRAPNRIQRAQEYIDALESAQHATSA